ncbi:hypothetical protein [Flindersiella endophytica]
MTTERIDPRGALTVRLSDQDGRIVNEQRYRNRIVKSGRLMVAQMFAGGTAGPTPAQIGFIGVGTDGTVPADTQAGLIAQRGTRAAISERRYEDFVDGTGGNAVARVRVILTAVFDFGEANGAAPLREAGSFNAATAGVMYNRVVFEPVTKTDAFKLTLLWDVEF